MRWPGWPVGLALPTLLAGLVLHVALARAWTDFLDPDEAVVALMAKHIREGRERPVFYYGQPYLGAMEAYLVAAGLVVMSQTVVATVAMMALALAAARAGPQTTTAATVQTIQDTSNGSTLTRAFRANTFCFIRLPLQKARQRRRQAPRLRQAVVMAVKLAVMSPMVLVVVARCRPSDGTAKPGKRAATVVRQLMSTGGKSTHARMGRGVCVIFGGGG